MFCSPKAAEMHVLVAIPMALANLFANPILLFSFALGGRCMQANHCASSAELPNIESWNRTSTSSLLAGLPNMGAAGKGADSSVPTKHEPRSIQSKDSSVMQTSRGTTGLDSDGCNAQLSGHPSVRPPMQSVHA